MIVKPVGRPYVETMLTDLYSTDILTLSAGLKNERLDGPDGTARRVSKLCGSWLEIDLNVDGDKVTECALRVQACALGQASAAILKAKILGATRAELVIARDGLHGMLKDGTPPPTGRFSDIAHLQGVAAYPARHVSTLLAFDAAIEAMERALS